jgi:glycosyl transferase family 87
VKTSVFNKPQSSLKESPVALRLCNLILIGLLTVSFLFGALNYWKRLPDILAGYGDFVIFYTGAQIVTDGNGDQLYDLQLQRTYHRKLGFVDRGGILPFNHPAYQLLPFLPVAHLPYGLVYVIWTTVNVLVLLFLCKLLLPVLPRGQRAIPIGVLFAFPSTMMTILYGQDSIITTLLLTAALVSFKSNYNYLAGICLGMGLYKPQLMIPFGLLLLIKRRWASLQAFIATGLVAVAISCAMIGWNGVIGYVNLVRWMNRTHYTVSPEYMANIRGLVEGVLHMSYSAPTNLLIFALSLVLYLWCVYLWRGNWHPEQDTFNLKFAHLICTTLLISYHLYPYDLTLLSLALILVLGYAFGGSVQTVISRVSWLSLTVIFCFPLGLHLVNEAGQVAWVSLLLILLSLTLANEIKVANSRNHRVLDCVTLKPSDAV